MIDRTRCLAVPRAPDRRFQMQADEDFVTAATVPWIWRDSAGQTTGLCDSPSRQQQDSLMIVDLA